MRKLPLFPLNTVLFPGMPLSLHIFEERYKQMINRCIDESIPFGVVLLEKGTAEERPGQQIVPFTIGCTAVISQVQHVGMGRMNIVAIGTDRFRVLSYDTSELYLQAVVEQVPFEGTADLDALSAQAAPLEGWIRRYLKLLGQAENVTFEVNQLPTDPLALTFLAASLLKSSTLEKQDLLQTSSVDTLVEQVRMLYRKEVTLLSIALEKPQSELQSPFSSN
jgi:uncharacterized protein